ncbi:MAG: TetR/AcrR family transcriptional regulator [Verrucomicrobiota bacterium]
MPPASSKPDSATESATDHALGAQCCESVTNTKDCILGVAERLFAKLGFDAVSLRQLTDEAGVNLAAVNYHFGSKDGLIRAVLEHRILPLNVERVRLLSEAVDAAGEKPVNPDKIVHCYVDSVLNAAAETTGTDVSLAKLISRFLGDQSEHMQKMVMDQFPEVVEIYVREICRSVPGLDPAEALIRLLFIEGSLVHSMLYLDRLHVLAEGFEAPGVDEIEKRIIQFATEGLTAPAPG